jgi:hypothetical protein
VRGRARVFESVAFLFTAGVPVPQNSQSQKAAALAAAAALSKRLEMLGGGGGGGGDKRRWALGRSMALHADGGRLVKCPPVQTIAGR